jgi:hypothetical protein
MTMMTPSSELSFAFDEWFNHRELEDFTWSVDDLFPNPITSIV